MMSGEPISAKNVPDELGVLLLERGVDRDALSDHVSAFVAEGIDGRSQSGLAFLDGLEDGDRRGQFLATVHRVRASDDQK